MSWFSKFTERIRRLFRRPYQEPEIITQEVPEKPEEPILEEPKEEPIIEEPRIEEEPEIPPEEEEKELPEEALAKVAIYYERIRGTRIRRKVSRTFSMDTSDGEIQRILDSQYDNGGNYVMGVETILIQKSEIGESEELERGIPGSADDS